MIRMKPARPPILARPKRAATFADQIAQSLREAIGKGAWVAGARLPTENELAAQFDVSRPVIREAMSVLKHEGLVTSRQGVGAFVTASDRSPADAKPDTRATAGQVLELVELRRAIEVEAAALAAVRRTVVDLRRIRAARAALNRKIAAAVHSEEEGFAFHRAIVLAAGNAQLLRLLDQMKPSLVGTMRVMRESGPQRKVYTAAVQREHNAVFEAIEAGNPDRARRAALAHFEASERRIRATDEAVWVDTKAAPGGPARKHEAR